MIGEATTRKKPPASLQRTEKSFASIRDRQECAVNAGNKGRSKYGYEVERHSRSYLYQPLSKLYGRTADVITLDEVERT